MPAAGTDAAHRATIDSESLRSNLAALQSALPPPYHDIMDAAAPTGLLLRPGRDGAATFTWPDETGRIHWLGRRSMPSISADALVEAFDPGQGNALVLGLGAGYDVAALLRRLQIHQALFVIDDDAWKAKAGLSLHDFSRDIRRRRLLLFVGPSAWDKAARFLTEHAGFLLPDRVLAWPWMDKSEVHNVSQRLTALQADVNRARQSAPPPAVAAPKRSPRVWIVSHSTGARAHRWARRLEAAARLSDIPVGCSAFDGPELMNPAVVNRRRSMLAPTVTLYVDSLPETDGRAADESAVAILVTHPEPLADAWIHDIPKTAFIFVQTGEQRDQLTAAGMPDSRIALLPPGADPRSAPANSHDEAHTHDRNGDRTVIVQADYVDGAASAAGLHLASHKRLWEAASHWVCAHVDRYTNSQAHEALRAAEAVSGIEIQEDDIRAGFVDRIRRRLGPHHITMATVRAVAACDVEMRIIGAGWHSHREFAALAVPDAPCHERPGALLVVPALNGWFDDLAADWLASGRPMLLRTVHAGGRTTGLQSENPRGIMMYASIDDLRRGIDRTIDRPGDFAVTGAATIAIIRDRHTWRHRLNSILELIAPRAT